MAAAILISETSLYAIFTILLSTCFLIIQFELLFWSAVFWNESKINNSGVLEERKFMATNFVYFINKFKQKRLFLIMKE